MNHLFPDPSWIGDYNFVTTGPLSFTNGTPSLPGRANRVALILVMREISDVAGDVIVTLGVNVGSNIIPLLAVSKGSPMAVATLRDYGPVLLLPMVGDAHGNQVNVTSVIDIFQALPHVSE